MHFNNENTACEFILVSTLLMGLTGLLALPIWASDKQHLQLSLMKIFLKKLFDVKSNLFSQPSASINGIISD